MGTRSLTRASSACSQPALFIRLGENQKLGLPGLHLHPLPVSKVKHLPTGSRATGIFFSRSNHIFCPYLLIFGLVCFLVLSVDV